MDIIEKMELKINDIRSDTANKSMTIFDETSEINDVKKETIDNIDVVTSMTHFVAKHIHVDGLNLNKKANEDNTEHLKLQCVAKNRVLQMLIYKITKY